MSFPGQQQPLPVNGSRMNMTPNQLAPSNRLQAGSNNSPHHTESMGNILMSQSRGSANMSSPVYSPQPGQYSQQQMSPVGQFYPLTPSNSHPPLYPVRHSYNPMQGGLYHGYAPVFAQSATTPQNYYQGNFPQPALSSHFQASTSIDFRGVNLENAPTNRRPQPFNNPIHRPSADSFSPQLPYSPPHRDGNGPFPSPASAGPSQPQRGIPIRTRLDNYQESARKDELTSKVSEASRRSARQRKPAQHFGHSVPSADLEDLLEDSKPQEIVATVPAATKPKQSVRPSAHHEKKRSHALVEDDDFEADNASSSTAAPKRSRLSQAAPVSQAVPRSRASATAKVAVKSEEDDRPEPRGQPEVWAEVRQALCESLPYYQSYHSAAYAWGTEGGKGGFCYGLLLDNDNDERGYMDEKSIITRTAGGFGLNVTTGEFKQTGDQNSSSSRVTVFSNNQRERQPIVVIVGAKNAHCPTRVPHRYNVLGTFQVTDSWSEKVKGKIICRIRLEMIDLKEPSWWGKKGSQVPTRTPDYTTKAQTKVCIACGIVSKQRYVPGWMCLNEECVHFSTLDGKALSEPPAYSPAFLAERNRWPRVKAPLPLKPAPPVVLLGHPEMETSLTAWKGMVCPACGRCNSRSEWDQWKCGTQGCNFEIPIRHTAVHQSALAPSHGFEAEGHAISFDKWDEPVARIDETFPGYWRKATYEIWPGNHITHYMTNLVINRQPGGADEILQVLQGEKIGMKRHALKSSAIEGEMLTRHFGVNYGLPYKFVAAMDSKAFSEAPPAILDALNHLTWAGQDAVRDGSYRPFNELLCLGYMESQSISYHDDGEKDLGPDIASLSLGGAATMSFRLKTKHWQAKTLTPDTYDPDSPVIPGSQAWKQRIKANDLHKVGRMAEYEDAKNEVFTVLNETKEKRKKSAPVVLALELRHGDMVVMHGDKIQEVYEHAVQPKGKLRYGLTGRYIKTENIPKEEHWKGEFGIPADKVYDGDVALFEKESPEEDDEDDEAV